MARWVAKAKECGQLSRTSAALARVPRPSGETGAILAIVGVIGLVVVGYHPGEVFIDTRPDLYLDPGSLVRESLSLWAPGTGLGSPNYDVGYLPSAVLMWLLDLVGVPTWLAMRLWRWGLLVLAALGARALFADLVSERGRSAGSGAAGGAGGRLTAAALYGVNPYVVVGAATTPILLPYALLPWLLLATRRSFDTWWRGAALAGVVFFGMGGMNAGVVPLFMVLAVPLVVLDARFREARPWGSLLRGTLGVAAACVAVSLYWIVATASAVSTASTVAGATEDPRTVAETSSPAEVLRGLGSWLMYGSDALGPYRPGFTSYLDNPATVVASFTLPLLAVLGAWLSRRRVRGLATALVVVGLVLMIGGHPPDDPSPFGRVLLWTFDHVPGAIAFRTTSKAGALAVLGMALLGALAMEALSRKGAALRRSVAGALVVAVPLSVTPALIGKLLPGELDVPDYWNVAADDLDGRDGDGRVLALPAESNALYRWRPRGVDDFAPVLIDRPVLVARSFPDGPRGAWSVLRAGLTAVDEPGVPATLLSTLSSYVGASDVLVRNDMLWELMGVTRPLRMVGRVEADPGLEASALYGDPGENTRAGRTVLPEESALAPLMRYSVVDPVGPVRLFGTDTLLVAGDNTMLSNGVWSGFVDGRTAFRFLGDMSGDEVEAAIDDGARVLLTDSNRRHSYNDTRLDRSGPLAGPGQEVPDSRTLGDADDQTVATYDGIADVTATASGSIFGPTPSGRPFLAVDGDDTTAWQFGDYGTAVGESITIELEDETSVGEVTLSRTTTQGSRIAAVEVTAGEEKVAAAFGDRDTVGVELPPGTSTTSISVEVTRVEGTGPNQVGLTEIEVPGVQAAEYARLPLLPSEVTGPVDVVMAPSATEQETSLNRVFTLPSGSTYRARARLTDVESRRTWARCRPLLTVDGERMAFKAASPLQGARLDVVACGPQSLSAGEHRIEVLGDHRVSRLKLRSLDVDREQPTSEPSLEWSREGAGYSVELPASTSDRYLVVAEGWDSRWRAELDGKGLGAPEELNGFALAWRVPEDASGTVTISFGPQRGYRWALGLSLLGFAACLVGTAANAVLARRSRREGRTHG